MSKDLKAVFHFWKRFACQSGLHRRDLIKGVAAASLGLAAGTFGAPQVYGNSNVSKSKGEDRDDCEILATLHRNDSITPFSADIK